jgi:hypothetical protein
MNLGWSSPFEDEFALCLLGARSPYETIAFPRTTRLGPELLDPDKLTPAQSQAWRQLFNEFLRKLSVRHAGRRLVLKSPPHTCRIPVLLDMFPRARFVHIVRNPYDVFASTMHLWRTLHRTQGLQTPRDDDLDECVLATFEYLHACVERDRLRIPSGQFHELRFEDLLEDPAREMQVLYERLGLAQTEPVRESIRTYFCDRADFRMNELPISADERAAVDHHWGDVIARHGYCKVRGPISPASSAAIT